MDDLVWHIPGENALDRPEELQSYLQNFPNSPLAPIFQREVDDLEALIDTYGIW